MNKHTLITIIIPTLLYSGKVFFEAYALGLVCSLVKAWTWLSSQTFPPDERREMREHVASSLYEEVADAKEDGYAPHIIAVRMLISNLVGIPGDVRSAMFNIFAFLPDRLERGSLAIRRFKTPGLVIASLAMFLMINFLGLVAEGENAKDLLLMNCALPLVIVLHWQQHRRWARRVLIGLTVLAVILVVLFVVVFTVQYRLYEHPLFPQLLRDFGIAILPALSAAVLTFDAVRKRIFGGNLRAVGLAWGIAFAITTGLAYKVSHIATEIFVMWGLLAVAFLMLVAMAWCFGLFTEILCSGTLRTTAFAMRVLAAGIRRLR